MDRLIAVKSTEAWVAALPRVDLLTSREREVFALLSQGVSNQALADSLYVSERTVRAHISNISEKLELDSRLQLCLASHSYNFGCRAAWLKTVADDNSGAGRP
ncbi:LuxR C-terminal-related transcriptional regulator [Streptomyces erythrochromogenes]|uniref:LuxR C-terminal-related transcriptional regulator n=1 Tax=Streptomyces erythrochromogenes TaxID=285574 RepID=UPI00224CBBDA|nr:LuxR C-terminal-related transcriptional regulator [Streptomyces erythrochromogenes]MCX5581950.1 LuxR C-terminal-related transcriptional regulator [Streptomyces erythrochromogenes]